MMKWTKRCVVSLLILFLIFLAISHMYMLYVVDVSMASVQPSSAEDIHLVSYADGDDIFKRNQNFQSFSVLNRGIDHIHMYRRKHLDAAFVEKNKEILNQKKGAGYWLWKPYVILKTLERVPENAIVVYLDSGINLRDHIEKLVSHIKDKDMLLVRWDPLPSQPCVVHIAQRKTLTKLGCTSKDCLFSPHMWAAIGVYRNTPRTRAFVKKWLAACEDRECLIEQSEYRDEYPEFQCHTHDESILSALAAQEKDIIATVATGEIFRTIIEWNHRHPKHQNISLLPVAFKTIPGTLRDMYKNWVAIVYPFCKK